MNKFLIWHEDGEVSCTTQFWKFIIKNCSGSINIDAIGKSGNHRLVSEVKNLVSSEIGDGEYYIIFHDAAFDNPAVQSEHSKLVKITEQFNNIYVSDLVCFEYLMLKFSKIDEWLKPIEENEKFKRLLELRERVIYIVENQYRWTEDKEVLEYVLDKVSYIKDDEKRIKKLFNISIEGVVTYLIQDISKLSGGNFTVEKKQLGKCWTSRCCWNSENECSLLNRKGLMTAQDKAEVLLDETPARKQLELSSIRFGFL